MESITSCFVNISFNHHLTETFFVTQLTTSPFVRCVTKSVSVRRGLKLMFTKRSCSWVPTMGTGGYGRVPSSGYLDRTSISGYGFGYQFWVWVQVQISSSSTKRVQIRGIRVWVLEYPDIQLRVRVLKWVLGYRYPSTGTGLGYL